VEVYLHSTVNFNKAIIMLKRKLSKDGIFSALRDRRDGVNKSGCKRIKVRRSEKRRKKLLKDGTKNRRL